MNISDKFCSVRHPGGLDAKSGIFRAAATSGTWLMPESWWGQDVAVCAEGVGLQYSITEASQPITLDALSDPTTGAPNPAAGFSLPANTVLDRSANGRWLNWAQKGTGSGFVSAYLSNELIKLGG